MSIFSSLTQLQSVTNESVHPVIIRGGVVILLIVAQLFIWRSVQTMVTRFVDRRSTGAQTELLRGRVSTAQTAFDAQSRRLAELTPVVPPISSTLQVIGELEKLTAKHNLKMRVQKIQSKSEELAETGEVTSTPGKEEEVVEEKEALEQLNVTFEASGNSFELLQFLEDLERSPFLASVLDFELRPVINFAAEKGSLVYLFELQTMAVFYLQSVEESQ